MFLSYVAKLSLVRIDLRSQKIEEHSAIRLNCADEKRRCVQRSPLLTPHPLHQCDVFSTKIERSHAYQPRSAKLHRRKRMLMCGRAIARSIEATWRGVGSAARRPSFRRRGLSKNRAATCSYCLLDIPQIAIDFHRDYGQALLCVCRPTNLASRSSLVPLAGFHTDKLGSLKLPMHFSSIELSIL